MAVVANTRLPHTIGLELATPGIGVFHLMLLPLVASHSVTARWPSPLPALPSPRNEGQLRGAVGRLIGGVGGADEDAGAGAAAAVAGARAGAPVTRVRRRLAGPCTRAIESIRPPRSLNVRVAFASTTRKTFSALGTRRTNGPPCICSISALFCTLTVAAAPLAASR